MNFSCLLGMYIGQVQFYTRWGTTATCQAACRCHVHVTGECMYRSGNMTTSLRGSMLTLVTHRCVLSFVFWYTVNLIILACLIFSWLSDFGTFTKLRIREFSFFFSSAIIKIIFAIFLNSRFFLPRQIRENANLANITRSTVDSNFTHFEMWFSASISMSRWIQIHSFWLNTYS